MLSRLNTARGIVVAMALVAASLAGVTASHAQYYYHGHHYHHHRYVKDHAHPHGYYEYYN
jgi:hypothetical protein